MVVRETATRVQKSTYFYKHSRSGVPMLEVSNGLLLFLIVVGFSGLYSAVRSLQVTSRFMAEGITRIENRISDLRDQINYLTNNC